MKVMRLFASLFFFLFVQKPQSTTFGAIHSRSFFSTIVCFFFIPQQTQRAKFKIISKVFFLFFNEKKVAMEISQAPFIVRTR